MRQNDKKSSLNERFMRACINSGFLNVVKEKLDIIFKQMCINHLRRTSRIVKNTIVFLTFSGNFDCNPKAIANEIIQQNLNISCCWCIYKPEQSMLGDFPQAVSMVACDSYECFKALASARVIIDNDVCLSNMGYKKKTNQILIETWHGSLGIKKFGELGNNDILWHKKVEEEAKMIDYIISNSNFEDSVYMQTEFKHAQHILKIGHPRNDILFCDDDTRFQILNKIRKRYHIADDTKLCLYAPTFRDGNSLEQYNLDYKRLKEVLCKRFGGNWDILVRFHNVTKNRFGERLKVNGAIDVSDYADIQEILACIDIGITDYSSWIFEYMLRRKPGFIFATDTSVYVNNERNLFYELKELPFSVAENFEMLETNICHFDENVFKTKCEEFLKDKGSIDDGHASERAVEFIKELMDM